MAEKTKIAIKLEEEAKPIKKMCEKLMDSINYELDKGIENVDTKELGEAIDMIKDLYEAKKEMYEACYYKQIMEAMEEHDFESEEEIMDEGRKGYRGQPRDSKGRYMSRRGRRGYVSHMMPEMDWDDMERMRDLDRDSENKMYYTDYSSRSNANGMNNYSSSKNNGMEGRSGSARRGYMESKEQGKDKQEKMKELERYTKELSEDVTEMIGDASPEEKSMLKQKLSALVQKI